MTTKEYQEKALRTDNLEIPLRLDTLIRHGISFVSGKPITRMNIAHLLHAVMGLAGEVGEIHDQMIKHIVYGKELDEVNLKEELGDCMWFINKACHQLGCTIEEIMDMNIKKLSTRYPDKFSYDSANIRDLEKERKALEGDKHTEVLKP